MVALYNCKVGALYFLQNLLSRHPRIRYKGYLPLFIVDIVAHGFHGIMRGGEGFHNNNVHQEGGAYSRESTVSVAGFATTGTPKRLEIV